MTASPAGPVIRPAVAADAEALGRCHLACWREAYTGMLDPGRLAAALSDLDGRVELWRRILAESPAQQLLAEHAGEVVGFATAGPGRDPDLDLGTELYAVYVRQMWWGTGLGHRLLTAALGDEDAFVWVLRENARARRSYARHGFVPDGAERVDDRFAATDIRMVRRREVGGG